ncbi:hypothetical protein E2A64_17705, partial [Pseudohoeflea suaedae]
MSGADLPGGVPAESKDQRRVFNDMRSVSITSIPSSARRCATTRCATAGRSLLGAALLTSTALVGVLNGPVFAANLIVDGKDQREITTPLDLEGGVVNVGVIPGSDATLTISSGGELESGAGVLGRINGAKGTVTVSGTGSWQADSIRLGDTAGTTGVLNVLDGGTVKVVDGPLELGFAGTFGSYGVAKGTATVSGTGSRLEAGDVYVGFNGEGALNVQEGGYARMEGNVAAGYKYGSTGIITVSGSGSKVHITGGFAVGIFGEGTLNVLNGGDVNAQSAMTLGLGEGSVGAVTVSGADSRLTSQSSLYVGFNSEATLNVTNGGYVSAARDVFLGTFADSNGTVTVSGKDARLTTAKDLVVGYNGEGTLNVLGGGYVKSKESVFLGYKDGSTGTVTVSGSGAKLKVEEGGVYVGAPNYESDGALTVSKGGIVEADQGFSLAFDVDSQGTLNIGAASGEEALAAGSVKGADGAAATIEFGEGDGTLVFNHTDENYGFDAIVSGEGLLKHEAGNTSLTGDWSAFTGTGEISGGVLSVDTDFGGSMTVLAGGTVAGSKTVDGDAEFEEGSAFQVDISSTDVLDVAGTVTIGSGADVVFVSKGALAFELGVTTAIMTAGEIDGEFGAVLAEDVFNGALFLEGRLSYTETTIDLTLDRNDVAFSDFTLTPTQAAIADAVESLGQGNGVFDTFVAFTEKDDVVDAVIALSGEAHASTQASVIQSAGLTRDQVNARIRSAFAVGEAEGDYAALAYGEEAKAPAAFDKVAGSTPAG